MAQRSENKKTFPGLARGLGKLPADKKRAALEVSAALAGISLRVSREFVEAVPAAAEVLDAEDIRGWGEFGRRLAMGSADLASRYFAAGVKPLAHVPEAARAAVFQLCIRQLVLSSSIAAESYKKIPKIAAGVDRDDLFGDMMDLALEIAQRSARHSADFLDHTPAVARALKRFEGDLPTVWTAVYALALDFANRTGGMTADLWAELPSSLERTSAVDAVRLLESATRFLEFGGSVTLHFVSSGAAVMAAQPAAFDEWHLLSRTIAKHGNAVLISFLRSTPRFFSAVSRGRRSAAADDVIRILRLTARIAESDAESALAAFRSSSEALKKVSIEQFEEWVETGIREREDASPKARRSYFALETRASNDRLSESSTGLALEGIQTVLRMYVEALTGREIEIEPLSAMPQESRIGDGTTIYLPSSVSEFHDDEMDFRLYKVLSAYGAGQIEFETFSRDTTELKAAFKSLSLFYSDASDARDAYALGGYLGEREVTEGEAREERERLSRQLPRGSDYRAVLSVFPEPRLARKIFGTVENARIDNLLRQAYRGLRRDLDLMRTSLKKSRPHIFDLPVNQIPFELLFQSALCGGATDDARQYYGQVVSEIESVIETFTGRGGSAPTVADSLMATSRLYSLFQNVVPEQRSEAESNMSQESSDFVYDDKEASESVTEDKIERKAQKPQQDISDLFSAWTSIDDEGEPDDLQGSEAWSHAEVPEQALETDDVAFAYDEWDRELNDYRVGWSRVIEKRVKQGDRSFVELTRSRYRGVISSIRHQFQLMKPENLTRINRELDGEDYDLNALVDLVIDRRADGRQSENIYTKRLRKQRDVAVSLLLDQSSSTARTITRNPLQPYTHPGRRIIEIEKEGLVLMSEALEAVGDIYSINGFTSEGRRNVKFYVVKDFDEKYSDETEKRIGGITFQNNTRLGAAIRHASHKLLRQESRTKLLIVLTDGRPYDHDYGDARYAREDVREALLEAKTHGVTPFCVTIDRESESELRDLYGDVGYTIIDDILSLPERMPAIYKRLTS